MTASKLAQFKTSHRGGNGCRLCGQPTTALIAVALRELNENHSLGSGSTQIASRQVSLCESCAVDLWPKVRKMLP